VLLENALAETGSGKLESKFQVKCQSQKIQLKKTSKRQLGPIPKEKKKSLRALVGKSESNSGISDQRVPLTSELALDFWQQARKAIAEGQCHFGMGPQLAVEL
jgi:hypothetical protein